jgi:chemotaxis response regulator CheB
MPIEPGLIYCTTPDHHLLIEPGHIHSLRGMKENGLRPAIDATLRTAARAYGSRVVGVILTGMLDDGTAGLLAVKRRGGYAIVQDPDEALYPSMYAAAAGDRGRAAKRYTRRATVYTGCAAGRAPERAAEASFFERCCRRKVA